MYRFDKITNLVSADGDVLTITVRVEPRNGRIAGYFLVSCLDGGEFMSVPCKRRKHMLFLHNSVIKYYLREGYNEY